MNKKWEEVKIGHHHNFVPLGHGCSSCGEGTKELKSIIRQREKELLARVREEVIKTRFPHTDKLWATTGYTKVMYVAKKLKEEQLKKLEIIAEEDK